MLSGLAPARRRLLLGTLAAVAAVVIALVGMLLGQRTPAGDAAPVPQ